MKRLLILLASALALIAIGWGLTDNRSVGEIVVCRSCSSIVRQSIHLERLPIWSSRGIQSRSAFCNVCGNQLVSYDVSDKCRNCGRIYRTVKQTAPRNELKPDVIRTNGFCSEACGQRTVTFSQACAWCGNIYYRSSKTVPFDAPEQNRSTTQGFCGAQCQTLAASQPATNKGDVVTLPPRMPGATASPGLPNNGRFTNQHSATSPDGTNLAAPDSSPTPFDGGQPGNNPRSSKNTPTRTTGEALDKAMEILGEFTRSREGRSNTARGAR